MPDDKTPPLPAAARRPEVGDGELPYGLKVCQIIHGPIRALRPLSRACGGAAGPGRLSLPPRPQFRHRVHTRTDKGPIVVSREKTGHFGTTT